MKCENCENCLHYGVCTYASPYQSVDNCPDFADKALYIKLPRKLNLPEELYRYMFDDNYQAFAIKCKVVKITGYGFILKHPIDGREWEYTYDRIGKTVFLTKEEAEKKLKELKNEFATTITESKNCGVEKGREK